MAKMTEQELDLLTDKLQDLLRYAFFSPNVPDDNMEPANLVDTTNRVAKMLHLLSKAFSPAGVGGDNNSITDHLRHHAVMMEGMRDAICKLGVPWRTPDGEEVGDLTEAVIYAGRGLHAIAGAIDGLADR